MPGLSDEDELGNGRSLPMGSEEVQALIQDATEQAILLSNAAQRAAAQLQADARAEAQSIVDAAHAEAAGIHEQADNIIADAEQRAAQTRWQASVDGEQKRAALEIEQHNQREALGQELADIVTRAEASAAERIALADAHGQELIERARRDVAAIRMESGTVLSDARAQADQIVEAARAEAARQLADSAEQTRWTQETVQSLRQAAELDAQRIGTAAHDQAAELINGVRQRLGRLLATSNANLRGRRSTVEALLERAEQELSDTMADAERIRTQAVEEAEQVRSEARAEAGKLVSDAERDSAERTDRADRRLYEAEAGARTVRERLATEVEQTQREANELQRKSRAEADHLITRARQEADEMRTQARRVLMDARAEIEALSKRREAITKELGSLSGVIEALAVNEAGPTQATES